MEAKMENNEKKRMIYFITKENKVKNTAEIINIVAAFSKEQVEIFCETKKIKYDDIWTHEEAIESWKNNKNKVIELYK